MFAICWVSLCMVIRPLFSPRRKWRGEVGKRRFLGTHTACSIATLGRLVDNEERGGTGPGLPFLLLSTCCSWDGRMSKSADELPSASQRAIGLGIELSAVYHPANTPQCLAFNADAQSPSKLTRVHRGASLVLSSPWAGSIGTPLFPMKTKIFTT